MICGMTVICHHISSQQPSDIQDQAYILQRWGEDSGMAIEVWSQVQRTAPYNYRVGLGLGPVLVYAEGTI